MATTKPTQFVLILALLSASLIGAVSCSEKQFTTDPDAQLSFSTDTLSFDTVFTTIGSATRYFKVYNRQSDYMRIDEIRLARQESFFRLNINGMPGTAIANEVLAPGDSLYIFVEVRIDPNNSNNPILVRDSVEFVANGHQQHVKLRAYGQDVHLINGQRIQTTSWPADKPYLIRNSMLVDTLQTLSIQAGAMLHFESNSALYVKGTLRLLGSPTDSVVLTGARTEALYHDVPGQWQGVWLLPGSVHNYFEHAVIKNAVVGIRADSLIEASGAPTLHLHNSRVEHHTAADLYAQGSYIVATNTLFGDCGMYALSLQVGGKYQFYHCTIANYWPYGVRSTPSVYIRNYYLDYLNRVQLRNISQTEFRNCIVAGSREQEIEFDPHPDAQFDVAVQHSLVLLGSDFPAEHKSLFQQCVIDKYPNFEAAQHYNYLLREASPARQIGQELAQLPWNNYLQLDAALVPRPNTQPDAGAWQYVTETE